MKVKLRYKVVFFFYLIMFGITYFVNAEKSSQEIRSKAVPVLPESRLLVDNMQAKDLINDSYFLENLSQLLKRKDFSEDMKVDAFYLMLKKIGWSFSGTVRIPANYSYVQIFNNYIGTFFSYQKALKSLAYDGSALLEIAKRDIQKNVVHASNAMLLAGILDPSSVLKDASFFLDFEKIYTSQVPDILLHYVSISFVLTKQLPVVIRLSEFLEKNLSEEGIEDILCSLSIFPVPNSMEKVIEFLTGPHEEGHDLAIETALIILKKRTPPDFFSKVKENLILPDPKLKNYFEKLSERNFVSSLNFSGKSFIKTWDNFDITLYDDGLFVSYKDKFTDFV